jgi:hypothetical protein
MRMRAEQSNLPSPPCHVLSRTANNVTAFVIVGVGRSPNYIKYLNLTTDRTHRDDVTAPALQNPELCFPARKSERCVSRVSASRLLK